MDDNIDQGALWGAEAQDWAKYQEPTSIPLWDAMMDATNASKGTEILDAGCAAGGASLRALARGAKVTAVDIAENSIEIAKNRLPGARVELASIGDLPFADNAFDAVICVNVIQFIPDVAAAMADLVRVTKPGGKVSVAIFGSPAEVEETTVFKAIVEAMGTPDTEFPEYRFSNPGVLEQLLRDADLKDIQFAKINTPFIYANDDIAWRAQRSAGSIQDAMNQVGAEKIEAAAKGAFAKYQKPDGSIHLDNMMWYATGTK
ncbi:MAG: methyltransferase domain-containing protein [Pseudomonadota bacterium]